MLIQAFLVCILVDIYLAQSNGFAISGVRLPKGVSIEQYNAKVRKYWTPQRLKNAKSLDIKLKSFPRSRTSANTNVTIGSPSSVPGTLPVNSPVFGKALVSNGRHVYTTGKVFFRDADRDYSCSGSIVSSNTGDLVSTVGHCVYDESKKVWFNSYWVFVPAYSNGNRPYGTWPARNFITFQGWTNEGDPNYDVAFVALYTLNRWHIQSYLGSQGIGFNFARLQYTYSFGYPGNINNSETRSQCNAYAENPRDLEDVYRGQGLPCNMDVGSSGGPWLQNVVESTGVGYVTSVNSFGLNWIPDYMYGPYFDSRVGSLYDTATNM